MRRNRLAQISWNRYRFTDYNNNNNNNNNNSNNNNDNNNINNEMSIV